MVANAPLNSSRSCTVQLHAGAHTSTLQRNTSRFSTSQSAANVASYSLVCRTPLCLCSSCTLNTLSLIPSLSLRMWRSLRSSLSYNFPASAEWVEISLFYAPCSSLNTSLRVSTQEVQYCSNFVGNVCPQSNSSSCPFRGSVGGKWCLRDVRRPSAKTGICGCSCSEIFKSLAHSTIGTNAWFRSSKAAATIRKVLIYFFTFLQVFTNISFSRFFKISKSVTQRVSVSVERSISCSKRYLRPAYLDFFKYLFSMASAWSVT